MNLKLGLLQSLIDEGHVPEFDEIEFEMAYPGDDCGGFNHEKRDALVELFDRVRGRLPALTELRWQSGSLLVSMCEFMWNGKDSSFDVVSLDGIERCAALRSISSSSMIRPYTLEPLTRLPALEIVHLGRAGDWTANWRPLLRIPKLRSFTGPLNANVWGDEVAELATRGVEVNP